MRSRLLTVGIPTWNRASLLRDAVESVVRQADRLGVSDEVEVVVCDNASTDETPEVVASLQASTRVLIRYVRNPENVGGVRNVVRTVEHAEGEFYLFLGDDDVMVDGALPDILAAVRSGAREHCVFVFQQSPVNPLADFAGPLALSAADAAERFFYYIGNAGVFALETAPAQRYVERVGADHDWTPWPQTEIMFAAMGERGQARPCLAVPVAAASSPHHLANTVYTSWYVWETAIDGLYRTAMALRGAVQPAVVDAALRHIFSADRMRGYAGSLAVVSAFQEGAPDTARTRSLVAERLRSLPRGHAWSAAALWSILALPAPAKRTLLVAAAWLRTPRHASSLVSQWYAGRAEYLRRREAAGREGQSAVRDYASTGY